MAVPTLADIAASVLGHPAGPMAIPTAAALTEATLHAVPVTVLSAHAAISPATVTTVRAPITTIHMVHAPMVASPVAATVASPAEATPAAVALAAASEGVVDTSAAEGAD